MHRRQYCLAFELSHNKAIDGSSHLMTRITLDIKVLIGGRVASPPDPDGKRNGLDADVR